MRVAAVFADDYSGSCSMNGPSHFVGSSLRWNSAGTALAESLLFIGGGTEKDTNVVIQKTFVPWPSQVHFAPTFGRGRGFVVDGSEAKSTCGLMPLSCVLHSRTC